MTNKYSYKLYFIKSFVWLWLTCLFTGAGNSQVQSLGQYAHDVDSLFVRASSGEVKYRELVEPSKQAIIDMGEAALPQMLTKLDTRDAREMHTIVDIFKGFGELAVDSLVHRLDSRDSYTRRLAVRCLGEIGSPKAVDALSRLAKHDDFRTRSGVMTALGKIASPEAALTVLSGLSDEDELVATAAAVACGKIREGIDPAILIDALSHPYYGVRYSACRSLVELGDMAVEPLINYIRHKRGDIGAGYAIEALGGIGSAKALKLFKETIKADDWNIRAVTAEALGNFKKSRKTLRAALKNETHPLVIAKLKSSLEKID